MNPINPLSETLVEPSPTFKVRDPREKRAQTRYVGEEFVMDNRLTFRQSSGETTYEVEYIRSHDIMVMNLLDTLSPVKRTLGKVFGANPTYVRITGESRLTILRKGHTQEQQRSSAIWEQMFFGNNARATINRNKYVEI